MSIYFGSEYSLDGFEWMANPDPGDPVEFFNPDIFNYFKDLNFQTIDDPSFIDNDPLKASILALIEGIGDTQEFFSQQQTPCEILNTLILFTTILNEDKIHQKKVAIERCWNFLTAIEDTILLRLDTLLNNINSDSLSQINEIENVYKYFLRVFLDQKALCFYKIISICKKDFNAYSLQLDKTQNQLNPLVVLLSLSPIQLCQKNTPVSLKQFLESHTQQLNSDLSSSDTADMLHPLIKLFNSGFAVLRENLDIFPYYVHGGKIEDNKMCFDNEEAESAWVDTMIGILEALKKLNSCSSVHSIISHYCNQLHYFPEQISYSRESDYYRIAESLMDFRYLIGTNTLTGNDSPKKYPKQIEIVWKEVDDIELEHRISKEKITIYADKRKIQNKSFSTWALFLIKAVSASRVELPYDFVFSDSGSLKRKRDDSQASNSSKRMRQDDGSATSSQKEEPSYYAPRSPVCSSTDSDRSVLKLLQSIESTIEFIKITGIPNKPCLEREINELANIQHVHGLELPIECFYSNESQIAEDTLNKWFKTKLSLSLSAQSAADVNKLFEYLNNVKCNQVAIRIENEQDLNLFSLFRREVKQKVEIRRGIGLLTANLTQCLDCLSHFKPEEKVNVVLSLLTSENPTSCKALLSLLEQSETLDAMDNILQRKRDHDCLLTLLSIISNNKSDFILETLFIERILSLCFGVFESCRSKCEDYNFVNSFTPFFKFIVDERMLSFDDCEKESKAYYRWLSEWINSKEIEDQIKIIKYVTPLLDHEFIDTIVDDFPKVVGLYLKYGEFPRSKSDLLDKHPAFITLLMKALCDSLPNLYTRQENWLKRTISRFTNIENLKDDNEAQQNCIKLLNYYENYKMKPFVEWPLIDLENKPILLRGFFHYWIKLGYKADKMNATSLAYLFEIFSMLKKHGNLAEDETVNYLCELLTISQNLKIDSFIYLQKLLLDIPIVEKALKKIVKISKEPYRYSILFSSGSLAALLLMNGSSLSADTMKHCAQVVLYTSWEIPADKINDANFVQLEEALWEEIKDALPFVPMSYSLSTSKLLWRIWNKKYNAYVQQSKGEREDLYCRGVVILRNILALPTQSFTDLSLDILRFQNGDPLQIFLKEMIERLLLSEELRINPSKYNAHGLLAIIEKLPQLNEASQKMCAYYFRATSAKYDVANQWLSRNPTCYNKILNQLFKRPLKTDAHRRFVIRFLAIDCPGANLAQLSLLIQKYSPFSNEEFCHLCSRQPHFINSLGRDMTDEEKRSVQMSKYRVLSEHMEQARPFVEVPPCTKFPLERLCTFQTFIKYLNTFNFDEPSKPNYFDPSCLMIDKVLITPDSFKEYITQLFRNVERNEKIKGAPEDPEERKRCYEKLVPYLDHIIHLLMYREPMESSFIYVSLADIGSKCFKPYPQLPHLYYSLIRQFQIPPIPLWFIKEINLHMTFENCKFENARDHGFKDRDQVIQGIVNILNVFSQNQQKGMENDELSHVYNPLLFNVTIIINLVKYLQMDCSEYLFLKLAQIDYRSSEKLMKGLNDLVSVVSIGYLIPCMNKFSARNDKLTAWVSGIIMQELEGKPSPFSALLKKMLCGFYPLQEGPIKDALQQLALLIENTADLPKGLKCLADSIESQVTFFQPKDLREKIIVILHHHRRKLFNDGLARLPAAITLNIHSASFIQSKVAAKLKLYEDNHDAFQFEDPFLDRDTSSFAEDLIDSTTFICNSPSFILNKIKESILTDDDNNKINFEDLIGWFQDKKNLPEGMTSFEELLDENNQIKDQWLVYLLEKLEIIKIRNTF